MGLDLNFDYNSVQNKINATKSYTDLKGQYNDTTKKAGEAFEKSKSDITGQIQNLKNQSKRYQKEIKTQLEQLLDINKITGGKGGNSVLVAREAGLGGATGGATAVGSNLGWLTAGRDVSTAGVS